MATPNALHVISDEANRCGGVVVSDGEPSMVENVMDCVGIVICFFASVGSDKIYEGIGLKCKSSDSVLDHAPMYVVCQCKIMCSDNRCVDEHMVREHVIGIGAV